MLGLRPLHLSIGWPSGTKILLNHEADVNVIDNEGLRPVHHAISRVCLGSLNLLEDANYALDSLEFALSGYNAYDVYFHSRAKSAGIFDYLIKTEAKRRRNLQALVCKFLPERLISSLGPFDDSLIDANAANAVIAIQQHGISIPDSLRFDKCPRTVYHLNYLTLDVLESLWKVGFRDINEIDSSGHTPLMKFAHYTFVSDMGTFLEMVDWFENKGIDINEKVRDIHRRASCMYHHPLGCPCMICDHTVLQILALKLGFRAHSLDFLEKRSFELFQRVITNETQDACTCACSFAGCRAVIIFFKGWLSGHWDTEERFWEYLDYSVWPKVIHCIEAITDVNSKKMISNIVRFFTFHALGLTHTCCRPKKKRWGDLAPFEDENEIQEIQDEEREDLRLLEDLLLEFDQQISKSNRFIGDFFRGYWRIRMTEVLSEEKSLSQDDLRESGGILHIPSHQRSREADVVDDSENSEEFEDCEDHKDHEDSEDPEELEELENPESHEDDESHEIHEGSVLKATGIGHANRDMARARFTTPKQPQHERLE